MWLFVAIVAGAALAGILVTLLATRRSRSAARKVHRQMRETIASTQAELDDAVAVSRRELTTSNELRLERDTAAAEVIRLRARLDELSTQIDRERDRGSQAIRELEEIRRQFSDIAGLEAEIAILRVIAARVPELEGRLAELEAPPADDIDLRPHGADNTT